MTPSEVTNAVNRRKAIWQELANLDSTKAGGLPNASGGAGGMADHVGYKDGLYRELEQIENRLFAAGYDAEGNRVGYETFSEGYT